MSLMERLLYPYMAPKGDDGDDLGGQSEADLAKLRGDDLEDVEEESDEKREEREADEAAQKAEKEEKAKAKAKAKDADEEEEEVVDEEEEEENKKVVKGKEEDDKKKTLTIPKARFDELNRKSKDAIAALSKQVEELTKNATVESRVEDTKKTETEIEKLDAEADALLEDGKTKEYAAKMREIRLLERTLAAATTKFESESAKAIAVEQIRLDFLVEKLESKFPAINPDADEYDQELVDEVMDLRTAFEKAGKSSSEALSKAVKYVFSDKVAKKDEEGKGKDKDEEEDEEKDDKKDKKDDKEKTRKKEAVARNAKDSKKIPAKTGDHGVDSDKKGGGIETKDVPSMSEEDFEALPESTKARLRGDMLEA